MCLIPFIQNELCSVSTLVYPNTKTVNVDEVPLGLHSTPYQCDGRHVMDNKIHTNHVLKEEFQEQPWDSLSSIPSR